MRFFRIIPALLFVIALLIPTRLLGLLSMLIKAIIPRLRKKHHPIRQVLVLGAPRTDAEERLNSYCRVSDSTAFSRTVFLSNDTRSSKTPKSFSCRVIRFSPHGVFSFRDTFFFLAHFFTGQPDLVSVTDSLSADAAAFLVGVPIRIRNEYRTPTYPKTKIVFKMLRLFSRFFSPYTVAASDEIASLLKARGFFSNKLTVIPSSVKALRKKKTSRKNADLRLFCHLDEQSLSLFANALALLQDPPPMTVILFTDQSGILSHKTLEQAYSDKPNDITIDISHHAEHDLCRSDLFLSLVYPTAYPPKLLLQSLSLSLPIIAYHNTVGKTVIDGKNGILVSQGCEKELADALSILFDPALRQSFGKTSYRFYVEHYRTACIVKRYDELYFRLLHRKGYQTP